MVQVDTLPHWSPWHSSTLLLLSTRTSRSLLPVTSPCKWQTNQRVTIQGRSHQSTTSTSFRAVRTPAATRGPAGFQLYRYYTNKSRPISLCNCGSQVPQSSIATDSTISPTSNPTTATATSTSISRTSHSSTRDASTSHSSTRDERRIQRRRRLLQILTSSDSDSDSLPPANLLAHSIKSPASMDASGSQDPPRLNLLALHGFRTSGKILMSQVTMAGLRPFFTPRADILYLNGPHPATGDPEGDVKTFFEGPYYEWYNSHQDSQTQLWHCSGMDASLAYVKKVMAEQGPFDGLLGFSQGGALASAILALQELGMDFQDVPRIKFAILIGSSLNRDHKYLPLYRSAMPMRTPVCVMVGEEDFMKERSEALASAFERALVIRHPRGHVVPRLSEEQQQQLAEWMTMVAVSQA